jgi:hypothetical protein
MSKILRGVALGAMGLLLLCACNPVPPPPPPPPTPDQIAQLDLIKGLNAENTLFPTSGHYDATTATLVGIDQSLNWNDTFGTGKNVLTVSVGDVTTGVPRTVGSAVVCISEQSASGTTFDIVKVEAGSNAGTYFGRGDDFSMARCDDASGTGGTYNSSKW